MPSSLFSYQDLTVKAQRQEGHEIETNENRTMKTFLTIVCIAGLQLTALSQQPLFVNQHKDSMVRIDPRVSAHQIIPGEILVKFRDEVVVQPLPVESGVVLNISSIDTIFQAFQVQTCEQVFPGTTRNMQKEVLRSPTGKTIEKPNLHNIHRLRIDNGAKVYQAIEALNTDVAIEYAEPNYILSLTDFPVVGQLTAPNDPLYPQQNYIQAIDANLVWDSTTGDTTHVIAILDTGVDWGHPDLQNKIWSNPGEVSGNGLDDDGNGYIDDVRGWDWINNDNNPMDDNSHGTHVAGIAAAEANNGIGISGISWGARIMAVKVFNAWGYGDAATIAQGITYASNENATVINMSFGSYGRSFTMENALINALVTSDLVASSGNDTESIYSIDPYNQTTFYPAALSYVLGVQVAPFSNYDPDGPIYSAFSEGFNYELYAPGSSLISTIPNGGYKQMTGTSMAAPVVSGAICLYKSHFPQKSSEDLWADLIHSSQGDINLFHAMFDTVKYPVLDLITYTLIDTLPGCDHDGMADAGETIQLMVQVRNTWAPADSVFVRLQQSIYGDTNDLHIVVDSSYLGSMGVYGSLTNQTNPFQVLIDDSCFNNRMITLNVLMQNASDTHLYTQPINFKIYNGEELSGILYHDTTLTPDKFWLINNSLRVGTGVTLSILPGTHLQINATVDNRGLVNAVGTIDSLIIIEGVINGNCQYNYINMNLKQNKLAISQPIYNSILQNGGRIESPKIKNCVVDDFQCGSFGSLFSNSCIIEDTYIKNSYTTGIGGSGFHKSIFENIVSDNGEISGTVNNCIFNKFINI